MLCKVVRGQKLLGSDACSSDSKLLAVSLMRSMRFLLTTSPPLLRRKEIAQFYNSKNTMTIFIGVAANRRYLLLPWLVLVQLTFSLGLVFVIAVMFTGMSDTWAVACVIGNYMARISARNRQKLP